MTADRDRAEHAVPQRLAYALDLLNFSLADVRDGLGPYLSIYLLITHHWDQASIGFVMGVGGIAAIAAQTPVGAMVDRTTAKRALVVVGALAVTVGSLAMPLFPGFYSISFLQAVTGIAGSAFSNGKLDLFQYGQSTNFMYTAPDGSTTFSKSTALGTQIVDGGVPAPGHTPASVPEPGTLISAGSALIADSTPRPPRNSFTEDRA